MNFHLLFANVSQAFRRNLVPGIILQAIAVSLAIAFYFWPAALPAFDFFAGLKSHYGIVYAIFSTALFGGLIPYCYLYFTGNIRKNHGKQFIFYLLFWAIKGAEVDLFYRLQGYNFGTGNDWQTVVIKTAVDQFFYASLWMVPTISLAYLWKESDFCLHTFRRNINRSFLLLTFPTIVISNWLVWLPTIIVVYLMPPNLQVPLYNLIQCFFVLLLAILTKDPKE